MKKLVGVVFVCSVYAWGWGDALAKQNRNAIVELEHKVAMQQERIDGLVSVIEGLNETVEKLRKQLQQSQRHKETQAIMTRLDAIERRIEALTSAKNQETTTTKKVVPTKKSSVSSEPASKRYIRAVRAYKKRAYTTAKTLFSQLAKEGYKAAASHFYLGEIAYYTKAYEPAIYHYKKSAQLNDKAGYMDVLMLHTAVSLEKLGKKDQAAAFYRSVIDTYQGRKSARIAQQRIRKL